MSAFAARLSKAVWGALLETLAEPGLTDDWQHMSDSTTVRGNRGRKDVAAVLCQHGLIMRTCRPARRSLHQIVHFFSEMMKRAALPRAQAVSQNVSH